MRSKLFGFVLALVAVATIGVVQQQTNAALPGQVGDAPRCTVKAVGARASAFTVNGGNAKVTFKVTGDKKCRVQLSTNSFYAPSMNGRPYEKQTLFDRQTKVFGPGQHTMSVAVPTKSTKAKGCYYQLDLTYGTRNVLPVLAYAHGRVNCEVVVQQNPVARCTGLKVDTISRTKFSLTGTAMARDGAKIKGYTFKLVQGGSVVKSKTITTSAKTATTTMVRTVPGDYKVRLTVSTSLGDRTSANCVVNLTIPPLPPEPPVVYVKVCDPETGETLTVKEGEEDAYVPLGDPACENVRVCVLEDGTFTTIKQSELDSNSELYSLDPADCEETEEPPVEEEYYDYEEVEELPQTGPADTLLQVTGAISLAAAGTYYWLSRRNA